MYVSSFEPGPRDYRCEQKTKLPNYEATFVSLDGLDTPFQETKIITLKNEPFSLEMHLKIQPSSRYLKLSISKPGCGVSALHFFVKEIPPMAF